MRAALLILIAVTSGCIVVGGTVGAKLSRSHNEDVVDQPARREVIPAEPPSNEERTACEQRRAQASTEAAAATDADTRTQILTTMPNCLALGKPAVIFDVPARRGERRNVATWVVTGAALGLLVDAAVVVTATYIAFDHARDNTH